MTVRRRPVSRPGPQRAPESGEDSASSRKRRRGGAYILCANVFSRYRNVPGWAPNLITAGIFLVMARVLGALVSPMGDCDEAFNYWEPLHYVLYGWGFQTWEYSPLFALRSYAFLLPYAALVRLLLNIPSTSYDKIDAFFAVRIAQALLCTLAELSLYDSVVWRFGSQHALTYLALSVSSPGIFRAAPELLPSSFAMVVLTAAYGRWIVGDFVPAVFNVALAALLGWIYAAAAAIPMAIHIMFRRGIVRFVTYAILCGAPIVAIMLAVDSHYYGKSVLVPFNHVFYNVFPVEGAGPDLFGVEPWSFYVLNLTLNIPLAVPLIALLPVLGILHFIFGARVWNNSSQAWSRLIFLSGPLIMGALLIAVPHKEERFLAPLYPLFALLSAVVLVDTVEFVSRAIIPLSVRKATARIILGGVLATSVAFGASRIYMQWHAFSAPLKLYTHLAREELPFDTRDEIINVCIGKEWHRFPSHFFIPDRRVRVRFLKHEFDGLLPTYYVENSSRNGSRMHQEGMNMFNREHPSQWFKTDLRNHCHYIIDLDLSHRNIEESMRREAGIEDEEPNGIPVFKYKFLDTEMSPAGYRAFWIPGHTDRLIYGAYVATKQ